MMSSRCRWAAAVSLFRYRIVIAVFMVTCFSRQVHTESGEHVLDAECSLTVPNTYTVLSGPLVIQVTCPPSTVFPEDTVDLELAMEDGNFTDSIRVTLGRPSGVTTSQGQGLLFVPCGRISRTGRYLATAILKFPDDHVTVASGRIQVTWPAVDLTLPESHVTLASELVIRASVKDVLCSPSSSSSSPSRSASATEGFRLELLYLGLHPDYTDRLLSHSSSPEPVVAYSHHVTDLLRLTSFELAVTCSAVDQAGFYAAALTSSENDRVAISNRMRTSWNPAYNLFLASSSGLFPCPKGSDLDLRYTQPLCHSAQDKIRLYRQVERVEGSGSVATPVDLVYVTERRAVAVGNVVKYPCALFDARAIGYCFRYVSTANSGSVREQRTLCIPVRDASGSASIVDGAWGGWSAWSPCSSNCGQGLRNRHRLCDSPAPSRTGRFCDAGAAVQSKSCVTDCSDNSPFPAEMEEAQDTRCRCGCELQVESIYTGLVNSFTASSAHTCNTETRLYRIKATRDHVIRLTFDLDVAGRPSTRRPWVVVRDGASTLSTMLAQSFDSVIGQTVTTTQPDLLIGLTIPVDDQSEESYDLKEPIRFKASFVVLAANKTATGEATSGGATWQWQTIVTVAGLAVGATILVCVVVLVCHRKRLHGRENEAKTADHPSYIPTYSPVENRKEELYFRSARSFEQPNVNNHPPPLPLPLPLPHHNHLFYGASNATNSSAKSSADFRFDSGGASGSRDRKGSSSSSSRVKWPDGRSATSIELTGTGNRLTETIPEVADLGNNELYGQKLPEKP